MRLKIRSYKVKKRRRFNNHLGIHSGNPDAAGRLLVRFLTAVLAGFIAAPCAAAAAEASDASQEAQTEGLQAENVSADSSVTLQQTDTEDESGQEYGHMLLPGAGFSYAFSARKVSLQDVNDQGDEGGRDDIVATALTPVQAKEQSVVNAVSQTQGIRIDNATATILSATAVTVVSDANIALQLAHMADRRQTQLKLDQGVITATEAETLMAAANGESTPDEAEEATISIADGKADGSDAESTNKTRATDSNGNELVVAQVNGYINVRADADTEAEIVGKLYNGSVAKVLGRTGNGWARIKSGDVTGYIREEYVATGDAAQQLVDSVVTKQAVVTTETLRVRAAPIADSDVITLIGQGETLDILEEADGWYKINTEDGEGYISSDFADVEEIYPEAISRAQEEAEEAAAAASSAAEEEARKAQEEAASSSKSNSKNGKKTSGSSALNTYNGSSGSGSASGQAVANYALQFVGNPYVWGGSSLTNGADCSGFTMAVYANFGVSLPHYTGSQQQCGTAVNSLSEAQPGDLILYSGHVAIYLGNNQIVHASNPRYGITTGTATYRNIVAIRRILQ